MLVRLPHALDQATKKPSARLLWAYITFLIAALSVISLHFWPQLFIATCTSIAFFSLCTVFYMLKGLSSFKADLDDKSIELDAVDGSDSNKN